MNNNDNNLPEMKPIDTTQVETPVKENTLAKNENAIIQQQMQNIPTVDQNKQVFINNTQAEEPVKKEGKKINTGLVLVILLFVVILVSIFFLFPIIFKNL